MGIGTWQISKDYPERFVAIAPVCWGGLFVSHFFMDRLKNLPVWVFHDKRDDVIPIKNQFGWWRESMSQVVMPN